MTYTDLFVIGGGPAGLAVAVAARREGLKVVLADGNRPPIDKACGEGLMPDSRRAAARIGIDLPESLGYRFTGIRFHGEGHQVDSDFPDGYGLGVRRVALHRAMIEAAEAAGVELRWQTPVASLDQVKARWVVGADGSGSRVRRWAGLEASRWDSKRFAYRRHFAVTPWTDRMEIYWGPACQIYVTPVGEREVCVALIARATGMRLDEALQLHFPALASRLAGAEPSSTERGAITATRRLRTVAHGNVALIGDASGSVDAITGEGLCLTFRQAYLLASAMADGDLAPYNRAHPKLALRPFLMSKTMLILDQGSAVRRLALGAMAWQPMIFESLLALHVA